MLGARCSVLGARCSVLGARCSAMIAESKRSLDVKPFFEPSTTFSKPRAVATGKPRASTKQVPLCAGVKVITGLLFSTSVGAVLSRARRTFRLRRPGFPVRSFSTSPTGQFQEHPMKPAYWASSMCRKTLTAEIQPGTSNVSTSDPSSYPAAYTRLNRFLKLKEFALWNTPVWPNAWPFPPFDCSPYLADNKGHSRRLLTGWCVLLDLERFIADCRMANQWPAPTNELDLGPCEVHFLPASPPAAPPKPSAAARSAGAATPCDPRVTAAGPPPRTRLNHRRGERENPGCCGSPDSGKTQYRAIAGLFFGRPGPIPAKPSAGPLQPQLGGAPSPESACPGNEPGKPDRGRPSDGGSIDVGRGRKKTGWPGTGGE